MLWHFTHRLEAQHLGMEAVVVDRTPPFRVVVVDVAIIVHWQPSASALAARENLGRRLSNKLPYRIRVENGNFHHDEISLRCCRCVVSSNPSNLLLKGKH